MQQVSSFEHHDSLKNVLKRYFTKDFLLLIGMHEDEGDDSIYVHSAPPSPPPSPYRDSLFHDDLKKYILMDEN